MHQLHQHAHLRMHAFDVTVGFWAAKPRTACCARTTHTNAVQRGTIWTSALPTARHVINCAVQAFAHAILHPSIDLPARLLLPADTEEQV